MFFTRLRSKFFLSCLTFLISSGLQASVSVYLPLQLNPSFERDLNNLAVLAFIPHMTRPYNLATIETYLPKIQSSHPLLFRRIDRQLSRYRKPIGLSHAAAELRNSRIDGDAASELLINSRGQSYDDVGELSLRAHARVKPWLALSLGTNSTENLQQPSGTYLSVGTWWAQLDIGYRDRWLSAMQGSSQILSTHARTMPSVSLSNATPLTLLGIDILYDFSISQMSTQPALFEGTYSDTGNPYLVGFHLNLEPLDGWSISATRTLQHGGGERPFDVEKLFLAFVQPSTYDNKRSVDEESGNQIAALSNRVYFDGRVPWSFAVEVATEDLGNSKIYVPGNTAITAGIYFPHFFSENVSLAYEFSDWQIAWYVNNAYEDGYTHHDAILGHWAFQRSHNAGIDTRGNSHFLRLALQSRSGRFYQTSFRSSDREHANLSPSWWLDTEIQNLFDALPLSLKLSIGKDVFSQNYRQLALAYRW